MLQNKLFIKHAPFGLCQNTNAEANLNKEKPPLLRGGLVRIYNVAEITFLINL
ncbi:hypothetical protein [Flavobacterium sp. FPG59]|jgi:hypothetical protein|uniref:hypothetical protein n=1 Tax=Flavobacterium sp. FPG59 TaxID=1929267 RepID=UPI0015947C33|nr:hypothetical protein [Flavobacterium sp. FPG59]